MATLAVLAHGLGGCMPDLPPPPARASIVSSLSLSETLPGSPLSPLSEQERTVLASLLARGRAAGLRQITVEIAGLPGDGRRRAIVDQVESTLPGAQIASRSIDRPLQVTLTGLRALPTRCLSPEPWFTDGLVAPGCSGALIFDRMAADPRDLERGRSLHPGALAPLVGDALRHDATPQSGSPRAGDTGPGTQTGVSNQGVFANDALSLAK